MRASNIKATIRPVIQVISDEKGDDVLESSKIVIKDDDKGPKPDGKQKKKKCSCWLNSCYFILS